MRDPLVLSGALRVSKIPSGQGDGSQYFTAQISVEPRTAEFDVSDGPLFYNGKPGNVQSARASALSLFWACLNCWRSRVKAIEFPESARVEEVPRQSEMPGKSLARKADQQVVIASQSNRGFVKLVPMPPL